MQQECREYLPRWWTRDTMYHRSVCYAWQGAEYIVLFSLVLVIECVGDMWSLGQVHSQGGLISRAEELRPAGIARL